MSDSSPDLAALFARMRLGDADAVNGVMSALYGELHRLAARQMRGEARQHTLQPTALVNEAYLRLMQGPDVVHDRHHFFALAAQAMRRVLVDHARQKRSPQARRRPRAGHARDRSRRRAVQRRRARAWTKR